MRQYPHLKKNRYGVYCFRLIFTQSVRSLPQAPQEISLSLETKEFAIAQERYMLLYPSARAFRWSLHESVMKGDMNVSAMQLKVTHWKEKNHLRELLAASSDELFEVRRSLLRTQSVNAALSAHATRMRDSNQRLKGALKSAKVMMSTVATSSSVASFSQPTMIEEAVLCDATPIASERTRAIKTLKSTNAHSESKPRATARFRRSETLAAYVEKFLSYEDEHGIHGKHTREARRTYLTRFLDIVGYHVALTSLSPDHIRHYRELMHAIPSNFEKRGFAIPKNKTQRPKWFERTIREWQGTTLSGNGIDTHFKHVRVFLSWALNEHYLIHDFTSLLKVSKKRTKETKKQVVNFMPDDLRKLFIDGYLYGDKKGVRDNAVAWHFWIPLIALYTGMRSEEIGALRLSSIVQIEGLWCIQIAQSKTEAGIRSFPIPQRLLDAGLLDYHAQVLREQNGDTNASLFPTLKLKGGEYSNRIGQFFNRNVNGKLKDGTPRIEGYLHKCGVENPSESQTLKFHSFRHGFITKWLESRLPLTTLKNIVGHRGDFKTYGVVYEEQNGATEAYIHMNRISSDALRERLKLMKQGMDSMDFGVDLSGISYTRYLARN
ncbi:site-specific integrase [Vibrio cholerae]|uniref:site-specific integrase n=1 Tax=Vibrio cholerae TaxID=666 RepID=UPI001A1B8160|nr:site-specific integrase [Vibrio cholerae]